MSPEQRPITPEGYERLNQELRKLWHEDRKKIVQEVSDAAAQGDRSENAEYIYGKKKLREIDKRIQYLSKLLEKLTIVDPKTQSKDRIRFGAIIDLEDEEGEEITYQIVGEDESDPKQKRISIRSPIARALLGKKEGDEVSVERPKGIIDLYVVRFRYE